MKRNEFSPEPDYVPKPKKDRIDAVILLGQRYMDAHPLQNTAFLALFLEQIKYLSPSLWLFQLLTILLVTGFAVSQPDQAENLLFQLSPLVSIMAVPEFIKDTLCRMTELERSCKNSGSIILTLRLIAVGTMNSLALALISGMLASVCQLNFFELLLYAFVPYNLANTFTLYLIQLLKITSRSGALALSLASALLLMALPIQTPILNVIHGTTLLAAWLISTAIFLLQLLHLLKQYPKGALLYGIDAG